MRITRLYQQETLLCGEVLQLDSDTSNHLIRVLRTKPGTAIILFNGDGFDYTCKTLDNNTKKTSVSIDSKIEVNKESNLNITLIQGLSRNDRMDATIQKSVELGVNKIIPVICQRSNTRIAKDKQNKKLGHWRKVAISACEQSGRCHVPEITTLLPLKNIHTEINSESKRFTLNPETGTSLKNINDNLIDKKQNIEIFIGPEGGLNEEEIIYLEGKNFIDIRFGPRILRTETAGPAVISAIQMLWGDF